MDCHALLQGIFPTQGSNLHLLHCRRILYRLITREAPRKTVYHFNKTASLEAGATNDIFLPCLTLLLLLTPCGHCSTLDTHSKWYPQPPLFFKPPSRKTCLKHRFKEVNKDPFSPEFGAGLRTAISVPKPLLTNWFLMFPNALSRKYHCHLQSQEG